MCSGMPSGRPLTPIPRDAIHLYKLLSGWISIKLGTNIHRVSGHC